MPLCTRRVCLFPAASRAHYPICIRKHAANEPLAVDCGPAEKADFAAQIRGERPDFETHTRGARVVVFETFGTQGGGWWGNAHEGGFFVLFSRGLCSKGRAPYGYTGFNGKYSIIRININSESNRAA